MDELDSETGIVLLDEPEAVQDLETGAIREAYVIDGRQLEFHLSGDEGVTFNDFVLRLEKSADNRLEHVYMDVMNLPVADLQRIGTVTGLAVDLSGLAEKDSVAVRFELNPDITADRAQKEMLLATTLEEFLSATDAEGMPLFFDLRNYFTEGVMSACFPIGATGPAPSVGAGPWTW